MTIQTSDIYAILARDLPSFGICYSPTHLNRLIKAGKFPKPFKISEHRNAWWKSDIVAFLEKQASESDEIARKIRETAIKAYSARAASRAGRKVYQTAEGLRIARTPRA